MAVRNDQLMRCCYCDYAVTLREIAEGGCPRCGSRKVKIAFGVTEGEKAELESRGYVFNPEHWSDKPWPVTNAA